MKRLLRFMRRVRAIRKAWMADWTGSPVTMRLGPYGRTRVLHFWPDGTSACHKGSHCICEVNWMLDSIETNSYHDKDSPKYRAD